MDVAEARVLGPVAAPGGDCACGRGPVVGILSREDNRLVLSRLDRHGPHYAHDKAVDWACVDCVADAAQDLAAGPGRRPGRVA